MVLSRRATKCGLHNSVLVLTEIGLEFVLRHPEGVDLTVTEVFLLIGLEFFWRHPEGVNLTITKRFW